MPLYFAYGSNMDRAAMAQRCPRSKDIGVARLVRHRFFISADGYASVARDPARTVWGIVWDLALADVPALDRYEELASGLYAKTIQPVLTESGPRRAMIYIGRSADPGIPKPGYMESLLAAAVAARLPRDYLRELETWAPQSRDASKPVERPAVRPLFSSPLASRRGRPVD